MIFIAIYNNTAGFGPEKQFGIYESKEELQKKFKQILLSFDLFNKLQNIVIEKILDDESIEEAINDVDDEIFYIEAFEIDKNTIFPLKNKVMSISKFYEFVFEETTNIEKLFTKFEVELITQKDHIKIYRNSYYYNIPKEWSNPSSNPDSGPKNAWIFFATEMKEKENPDPKNIDTWAKKTHAKWIKMNLTEKNKFIAMEIKDKKT